MPPTTSNQARPTCRRRLLMTITIKLTAPARVTITITAKASGRLVQRFTRRAASGTNRFRVTPRALAPGAYRLIATPVPNAAQGGSRSAVFQVVR